MPRAFRLQDATRRCASTISVSEGQRYFLGRVTRRRRHHLQPRRIALGGRNRGGRSPSRLRAWTMRPAHPRVLLLPRLPRNLGPGRARAQHGEPPHRRGLQHSAKARNSSVEFHRGSRAIRRRRRGSSSAKLALRPRRCLRPEADGNQPGPPREHQLLRGRAPQSRDDQHPRVGRIWASPPPPCAKAGPGTSASAAGFGSVESAVVFFEISQGNFDLFFFFNWRSGFQGDGGDRSSASAPPSARTAIRSWFPSRSPGSSSNNSPSGSTSTARNPTSTAPSTTSCGTGFELYPPPPSLRAGRGPFVLPPRTGRYLRRGRRPLDRRPDRRGPGCLRAGGGRGARLQGRPDLPARQPRLPPVHAGEGGGGGGNRTTLEKRAGRPRRRRQLLPARRPHRPFHFRPSTPSSRASPSSPGSDRSPPYGQSDEVPFYDRLSSSVVRRPCAASTTATSVRGIPISTATRRSAAIPTAWSPSNIFFPRGGTFGFGRFLRLGLRQRR